jgi:alpha-1,3-rhamnosyl/mannosyltransferase
MHVCVDASPLLLRSAGVKNYLFYWLRSLEASANGNRLSLFPFLPAVGTLDHERSVLNLGSTIPRVGALLFCNLRHNPAIHWLARRGDIFHATNQIRQPVRGVRLTATIHDMTCWLMPQVHTRANVKADRSFAANILRRADGLIAVSENTRRDAIQVLGLDPERIVTIHSGVAAEYFEATDEAARQAAERYSLRKPYILFIGTVEPRKNLDVLLDAFAMLPGPVRREFELVVAGPMGWAGSQTMERFKKAPAGVRYLGYVPETSVPALTRGAVLFAYPSLYEGFGFPVAQAMACGVPVLTSNVSCLPEISGGGSVLIDPQSPSEICNALERLLTTPSLRKSLGERGRAVAIERYRWETSASKSWRFFERVHRAEKPNRLPLPDKALT